MRSGCCLEIHSCRVSVVRGEQRTEKRPVPSAWLDFRVRGRPLARGTEGTGVALLPATAYTPKIIMPHIQMLGDGHLQYSFLYLLSSHFSYKHPSSALLISSTGRPSDPIVSLSIMLLLLAISNREFGASLSRRRSGFLSGNNIDSLKRHQMKHRIPV
jgi:hypothetical protein